MLADIVTEYNDKVMVLNMTDPSTTSQLDFIL